VNLTGFAMRAAGSGFVENFVRGKMDLRFTSATILLPSSPLLRFLPIAGASGRCDLLIGSGMRSKTNETLGNCYGNK
jgi:hypothetical protein